MISEKWQISLLGTVSARQGRTAVSRFATRHTALLFARLALRPGRTTSREELVELLWPESDAATGKTRLRVALSSLRRQLEPPGTRPGSVLIADRMCAAFTEEGCLVDAVEYRKLVEQAMDQTSQRQAIDCLLRADALYGGPFCYGLDADWVRDERTAFAHLQATAQMRLGQLLAQTGDISNALKHARRAVDADPLSEPARRVLVRLILASGQPEQAARELEEFRRFLFRETGLEPAPETLRVLELPVRPVAALSSPSGADDMAGRPVTARSDNLPKFTDAYVERPDELSSLEALLCMSRVLTLVGPGGVGKTRLAVELVWAAASSFGAGIWFVSVPAEEPGRLIDFLSTALEPARTDAEIPLEAIRRIVGSEPGACLIVLDGAETLPASAAGELYALLRAAPNLSILLTSRRKLGVVGEHEYQVQPLPVPDENPSANLEDIAAYPSVRLFVERVRISQPDFQVNTSNADALAKICRSLDGIPLAIELAAAQVRRRPLASIVEELHAPDARSSRRTGGRTLQAAISASFDSLSSEDHRSLLELSVFTADFGAAAASSVLESADSVQTLERLTENSLLNRHASPSGPRYKMLASIRDFGWRRLAEPDYEAAGERHAAYYRIAAIGFSSSVFEVGPYLFQPLDLEWENVRSALLWLSHRPERLPDFCSMVTALTWFWVARGRVVEGLSWVRRAQDRVEDAGPTVAKLLLAEGTLSCYRDDAGPAIPVLVKAIAFLEQAGDPLVLTSAEWTLGFAQYLTGAYDEARELLERSLHAFESRNLVWWSGATYNLLGFTECAANNLEQAEAYFQASSEKWKATSDRIVATHNQLGLARVYWKRGEVDRSQEAYRRCMREFQGSGDTRGLAYSIEGLARVSASSGKHSLGARLMGISQKLRETQGRRLDFADSTLHRDTKSGLEKALGSRFDVEWKAGHRLSPEAGIEYATGNA